MMHIMRYVVLCILLFVLLTGCITVDLGDDADVEKVSDEPEVEIEDTAAEEEFEDEDSMIDELVKDYPKKTVEITAYQFGFEPNVIYAKVGEIVHINLVSRDVIHGFTIDEFWKYGKPEDGIIAFKNKEAMDKYKKAYEQFSNYSFGSLYGYPEKDIAHFYSKFRSPEEFYADKYLWLGL